MTRGFLLGKFLPPHAGHLFLCQGAGAMCDDLTVLVCSLPDDPIPGEDRFACMTRMLPGVRVIHHDQVVPQDPRDDPDFWSIWRDICCRAHPEPVDMVFGSESYVNRLAAELGAEAVLIDPERQAFPVSGTAVRADPAGQWHFVPGLVRPFLQRRVVLVGAESVGKTTMAARLAARFRTLLVPEYGRTYDVGRSGRAWTAADFDAIAQRHRALRAVIRESAGPVLIEDTDPLLTQVWKMYLTGAPPNVPPDLADLYLVLDVDVPWTDDGTRYQADPAGRAGFQTALVDLLMRAKADFRLVGGSWDDRLESCVSAVHTLLAAPATWRDPLT